MSFKAKYNKHLNLIESTYKGIIKGEELMQQVLSNIDLAKKNNTHKFLTDCRELSPNINVIDSYKLVKLYEKLEGASNMKEAILIPDIPEAARAIEFYETVSLNRGFQVKAFTDRDEALSWLLSD